jgi:hypothetical protein
MTGYESFFRAYERAEEASSFLPSVDPTRQKVPA